MRTTPIVLSMFLLACSKPSADGSPSASSTTTAAPSPACKALYDAAMSAKKSMASTKGASPAATFDLQAGAANQGALAVLAVEVDDPALLIKQTSLMQMFRDVGKALRAAQGVVGDQSTTPEQIKASQEALVVQLKRMNEEIAKLGTHCGIQQPAAPTSSAAP